MADHPAILWTALAAWNLTAARNALTDLRLRQRPIEDVRDGLRSSALGVRYGLGRVGDPVATTALLGTNTRDDLADLATRTTDTLNWLAAGISAPPTTNPLDGIHTLIPRLTPRAATGLTPWLDELDQKIRTAIGHPEPVTDWPGTCPACTGRACLRLHTAAPDRTQWVITCGTGCVCTGNGCPCRMPTRPAGTRHIWLRATLVAPPAVPSTA